MTEHPRQRTQPKTPVAGVFKTSPVAGMADFLPTGATTEAAAVAAAEEAVVATGKRASTDRLMVGAHLALVKQVWGRDRVSATARKRSELDFTNWRRGIACLIRPGSKPLPFGRLEELMRAGAIILLLASDHSMSGEGTSSEHIPLGHCH